MGLDASTTTIGVSIIDYDDNESKLIHHEFYKPLKKDLFKSLSEVRKFIINKIEKYKPDDIVLEDIILFMKGHSTAKTVSSLAVLNRTVGLAVFDYTGNPPHLFNVMKIRHAVKKDKKMPSKEEIPELVASILGIDFPYEYGKTGKLKAENFDVADSICAALAFIKISRKSK